MEVLVTGAAGYFGGAVLRALGDDPRISAIVATDVRAPAWLPAKARYVARDLLREGIDDLVTDAVIHLAFTVERRPGVDPGVLNVEAAETVLAAAVARAEVVLFASSVMAYGFQAAPGQRLRETDVPGPAHGFYYAAQKQAAEQALARLPGPARVVVARPCAVGGPRLDDKRAAIYRGRWLVMPRVDHDLYVQLLHEDDLGRAFAALLHAPSGTYNVAPDDALTTREVAAALGQRHVTLPMGLCAGVMDLAWRHGQSLMDGAWVRTLAYPAQVADNAKLRQLGWEPAFTTRQTVSATAGRVVK